MGTDEATRGEGGIRGGLPQNMLITHPPADPGFTLTAEILYKPVALPPRMTSVCTMTSRTAPFSSCARTQVGSVDQGSKDSLVQPGREASRHQSGLRANKSKKKQYEKQPEPQQSNFRNSSTIRAVVNPMAKPASTTVPVLLIFCPREI